MNDNKSIGLVGTTITTHQASNPFLGKKFRIDTLDENDTVIDSVPIEIESMGDFNTTLEDIKQFNITFAYLSSGRRYRKLVTE